MLFIVAAVVVGLSSAHASIQGQDPGTGVPAKYLASCEADLTGDGVADLALLLETVRGQEAIALVATESGGYDTFVLSRGRGPAILRCAHGAEVRETRAGREAGRVLQTPGAYISLLWPEASSVAYVWGQGTFTEIWTSD